MTRPLAAIGRRLPHGWRDLLLQLGLFFVAYQGYQLVRGLVDGKAALAFDNAETIVDDREGPRHVLRAGAAAGAARRRLADRHRQLALRQHPLRDHDDVPRLALPVPQRALPVRPQHVPGRDGDRPDRLRACSRRRRRGCSPARASPTRSPPTPPSTRTRNAVSLLVNKYAAVPSMHIGFALMIAGTAVAVVANRAGRVALGALSAARLRRRGRHREPLLARRRAGRAVAARRRIRRAPSARAGPARRWSFGRRGHPRGVGLSSHPRRPSPAPEGGAPRGRPRAR